MIVDAYYYWQQGVAILVDYGINLNFDIYHYLSPTLNSVGVVFFASLLAAIGFNPHTLPVFFFLVYLAFLFQKNFDPDVIPLFVSLSMLSPLLFINSKEAYIYIASFFMLQGYYSSGVKSFVLYMTSLMLFFFARYEIIFVLAASYGLLYIPRGFRLLSIIGGVMVALLFFREDFLAGPVQLEKYLMGINSLVFKGDYEYVLLTSDKNLIIILLNRFFLLLCLPIKWLIGIKELFNQDVSFYGEINIIQQFLFSLLYFWYCLVFLKFRELKQMYNNQTVFRYLCNVVGIYIFYYGVFVFHQPTRQVIFMLSIFLLLTSVIKNRAKQS